jgi:RNA polymerase sigma-70 factor, ECF subfamily
MSLRPCGRDVEREVASRLEHERVRRHLATMTEGRAMTVFLHDGLGYDLAEISRLTDVSVAAAQSRLVRGRRQLRKCLETETTKNEVLR